MTSIRRSYAAAIVGLCLPLAAGCTTSTSDVASTTTAPPLTALDDLPPETSGYAIEVLAVGSGERRPLIRAVPVGQVTQLDVTLQSGEVEIIVGLAVEVTRSAADGSTQTLNIELAGIDTSDADTMLGLLPIIGSRSIVDRDGLGAVESQSLEIPENVGVRADAVARQALQAPFLLGSPLPSTPLGVGGSWSLSVRRASGEVEERVFFVEAMTATDASVSVTYEGGAGQLDIETGQSFPTRQQLTFNGTQVSVERVSR